MIQTAKKLPTRKSWAKWIRSSADEQAVREGCWFDIKAADRVREFFSKFLRHSVGEWAGKPFELLDWQWNDFIAPLYGWRREDGSRRYRRAYVQISKKNGKSALASGLALYHLCGDGEAAAEVLCAAADRQQAGIVFNEAANMVNASPALAHRLQVVQSSKRIVYYPNSTLRALSADAHRNEGWKPSCIIVDELHAQPNRRLWDALRWGGAARREPLMLAITTAGWDRTSICFEEYLYAKGILAGRTVDSSYFAYIAEAEESDDWTDEKVWHKANPSLGHTISLDSFRDDFRQAFQSIESQNSFRRYRLNQWTDQETLWIDMDAWAACSEEFSEDDLIGRECFAGLDMAATQDIASLVLMFHMDDGTFRVLPYFWAPEKANERRERNNKARLDFWFSQGLITKHSGDEIDFGEVQRDIQRLAEMFVIRVIAKDGWNTKQMGQNLLNDGFDVRDFGQGIGTMSAPCKEFKRRLHAKLFRHNSHPVLNWMAKNVCVYEDAAENIRPLKKKSTDKIDGIVSAIMATGLTMSEQLGDGGETIWL